MGAVVLGHAECTLTTQVVEANVHTVFHIFTGEQALFVVRTLLIALAKMLCWNLTLTGGIADETWQTLAHCLVTTANAVGVQTTADVAAHIRAVLQAR